MNGDGFPDRIVGAPSTNQAMVYLGSAMGVPSTPSFTLSGPSSSSFGTSVSSAGDVNGDGYADVVVGAPGTNQAFVFLGGATGLATTGTATLSFASGSFGQTGERQRGHQRGWVR